MKCRLCHNTKSIKTFTSVNENVEMFVCSKCKCHNKLKTNNLDYDDKNSYWVDIKDPDGKIRDMTSSNERDFKLKNWYGGIPNYINSFNDPKVLDVGCGLGYLLSGLTTKYKYGVEPSSYACELIKNNYKDIKIFNENFEYINKLHENFDIITAYHVIEHLTEPEKFIKLVKSKLRKNGKLIIGTPLIGTFLSNYFGKYYRQYNQGHEILFNYDSLKKLLEKNNFKIIKKEKPFFKTDYFNFSNILRLFNNKKISPPYYGSIITLYAESN